MDLKPKTFKKYHEAEETQLASKVINSIPLWSIGLNLNVNGNGTRVVTNPENVQLIHPPIKIMGRTLVTFPLSMSVIMEGSVIGLGACPWGLLAATLKYPVSSALKKAFLIRNPWRDMYFPFSRKKRALINDWLSWTCCRVTFLVDEISNET